MSSVGTFDQVYRDLRTYNAVHLCMSGILILPTVVLWLVSFCVVRRRGDPVRHLPFTWMKVAYPMFAIALFFSVATLALSVAIYTFILDVDGDYTEDFMFSIQQAADHAWELFIFFDWLTMLAIVLCVVELGLAFLRIWHGGKMALHPFARYGAVAFAVLVFALALGHFGRTHSLVSMEYDALRNRSFFSSNFSGAFYAMVRLRTAIDCLIFVAAVALVGFTGMVYAMSLKTAAQSMRRSARIFLVIGILFLLRCTWKVAYDASFLLPRDADFPNWPDVVEPLLNDWVTFVILVLIFVIGCRKRDGLWSQGHQWNSGAAVAQQQQQQQQQQQTWAPQDQAYGAGPNMQGVAGYAPPVPGYGGADYAQPYTQKP